MKRYPVAFVLGSVLALGFAGCSTVVPPSVVRVNANVTQEVEEAADRTYYLEVPSREVLALVQPLHEEFRRLFAAHGYEEVLQARASFVIAINASEAVRTAPPGTMIKPRESAAERSPNNRFTRADAILPNRNQEFLTEDMNGPADFTIGPEGKIIATGLARTPDEAAEGFAEPPPDIQYKYTTMLSLQVYDAENVAVTGSVPRWQVVVIGESYDENAPIPLGSLLDMVGDYVERSSGGEVVIALASPAEPAAAKE